jgi:CHASE2 domain-containing sensor protein
MMPASPDDAAHVRLAASRAAIARSLAPAADGGALGLLAPTVQRHPWALVGAAALAGALLISARPWRWLPRGPMLLGLVSQFAWRAYMARDAAQRRRRPDGRPPTEP